MRMKRLRRSGVDAWVESDVVSYGSMRSVTGDELIARLDSPMVW